VLYVWLIAFRINYPYNAVRPKSSLVSPVIDNTLAQTIHSLIMYFIRRCYVTSVYSIAKSVNIYNEYLRNFV